MESDRLFFEALRFFPVLYTIIIIAWKILLTVDRFYLDVPPKPQTLNPKP